MKLKRTVILGVLCVASMAAMAQWQWIGQDGRKVFSDRPPPSDIPEKNILKQPAGRPTPERVAGPAPNGVPSTPGNAASATNMAPRLAGKDKELEEKKKQAEQAEVAKKQAEEEKFQKTRAENCSRAQQAKAGFDSGARIATTNKAGERVILDDEARAAEAKRLQSVIQSECK
ncbi:MAG: DUF4124 domain-containing protein [Burkholderiaceae bacterium]